MIDLYLIKDRMIANANNVSLNAPRMGK